MGTHLYRLHTPVGGGRLFLAEHALAGTGSIHQNPVKILHEPLRQLAGMLVEHQGIGHCHALQIAAENHRPLGFDLVGHQQPLAVQQSGQLGGLPARGSAQVQHPHAWLHIQQPCRGHGTGLLEIIQPRLMVGRQAGSGIGVIVIAAVCPRHRGEAKLGQRGRGVGFQFVQAQRHPPGMFGRRQKLRQLFRAQLGLQPFEKSFWKHELSSVLYGEIRAVGWYLRSSAARPLLGGRWWGTAPEAPALRQP